ncbi:MAG: hypothetical protein RBS39_11110 [Phycisphaerales bacterium]|jgi:hypothetical protein|nr:hypothetical protein [Phycisphaerales bacterium]
MHASGDEHKAAGGGSPDEAGSLAVPSAGSVVPPPESALLARELTGDLPCVRCRYNLRGLSVRDACPECGLAVGATILWVVDPHAEELQPIPFPRLTWLGLLMWSWAALGAAIAAWSVRLLDAMSTQGWTGRAPLALSRAGVWLVVLSGLGALVLVRPHPGLRAGQVVRAALGVALYVPLVWTLHAIWLGLDVRGTPQLFLSLDAGGVDAARHELRLLSAVLIVMVIACLRPSARRFVSRSLVMRTGRVDRQTMLAVASAVGVGAIGDVLLLSTEVLPGVLRDGAEITGVFCIAVGAMLVTLGLGGVAIDSWRLGPAIVRSAISMKQLFGSFPDSHGARPAKGDGA